MAPTMAADPSVNVCLNHKVRKTESIASSSSSSSESGSSSASGKALLTLSKPELDRLIAENMSSVLKTLKKRKHAKKHARLRQAAVEEAVPEDGDTMAGKEEQKASTTSVERSVGRKGKKETSSHKANKHKQTVDKKATKHSLKEVQPDAKNESTVAANTTTGGDANSTLAAEKLGKENKTINAFQLMMTARSKCIGSNSPGREREAHELSPSQQQEREKKAKRNLQLQEWAEKKGSAKRRLQEEAKDEYIDNQLNKRAKRLKKLIGNMSAELEEPAADTQEKQQQPQVLDVPDEPIYESTKPVSRRGKLVDSPVTPSGTLLEETKSSGRKARGRSRKNALPAAVDTPEPEPAAQAENVSTDPFLEQLSSPRKKKDSLLGYFAKLTPETRKPNDSPSTTKLKKHPTPSSTANGTVAPGAIVTVTDDDDDNDGEKNFIGTPPSTGRPKRSCANRIKDYSAFEKYSPAKEEQKPLAKKPPIVTPLKIINVQSPNAMKVVKSPSMRMFASAGAVDGAPIKNGKALPANEYPTTPKSVKLAPLFVRSGKPPPPDPEKARARHLFLMSGMPEKMRQEIEKRTAYEDFVLNESPVFPLVSHVRQEEALLVQQAATNFNRSCIKVRPAACGESSPAASIKGGKNRKIRYGMFTECSMDDYEDALDRCVEPIELEAEEVERNGNELPEVQNVTDIVRDYKQRYPHFPVFRCYKQFRAIYKEYQQQQQQQQLMRQCGEEAMKASENNDIFQADESIEIIEPTLGFRNGEMLFTEKYKPQDTKQILINFPPANLLSQFLSLWQQPSQQAQDEGSSRRCHGDYFCSNGDDDFELSNGSSASVSSTTAGSGVCNHVVLVGPPGCGKTCNVYAVANELNFNVLEINASSRRKGKIILQELLEATQSHLVRQKPKERSNSTDGFLQNGGGIRPKGVGGKKNGLNSAVFRCLEQRSSFSETNGTSGAKKLSLILIEDADIVFEQDDGFLGAINQLIATSKRPIVLTTTNPSCVHMARYMTRNNVIQYVAPGIGNVAKLLSLMALVEQIPIDQHDLGRLYAYNKKDMRKTLNELQFFVQSGGDMPRFSERCDQDQEFRALETAGDNDPLNETREDEEGEQMDEKRSQNAAAKGKVGRKKAPANSEWLRKQNHVTLYDLFTRNQNEHMVLRIPLDFNALWCNMELVLRMARDVTPTPASVVSRAKKPKALTPSATGKRGKRGSSATVRQPSSTPESPPDVVLCEELSFLYENISRAEAGWGMTQRNRIRYGKDIQDEQQQQQLANELGHALVEGSWIDWFSRRRRDGDEQQKMQNGAAAGVAYGTVKAYDALRKLEHEPRQTIASYIGVSGVRSRVTACDYEPLLRQICRHERDRSSLERRGSRFYHYLRNFTPLSGVSSSLQQHHQTLPFLTPMGLKPAGNGFSVDHFDALSHCFEERTVATVAASPDPAHGPTD